MKIGYARVLTAHQNINIQLEILKKNGCELFFTDIASGSTLNRTGLTELLKVLKKGDVVMVENISVLTRSLSDRDYLLNLFYTNEVNFISINDDISISVI